MSSLDFLSAIQWVQRFDGPSYARRLTDTLPHFAPNMLDQMLMLDTTVYIDRLQGKISAELRQFLEAGAYMHSSVAFQELMVSIGALSPRDPRTQIVIDSFGTMAASINPTRISVPDVDDCIEGALLAGTLARIQGYGKEHRFRAVNDCTLVLQSQKLGTTLLTRNYADFDILLQMMPEGRVAFY